MKREGGVLVVGQTRAGRALAGLRRFAAVFPIAAAGLGVLFVIEFVGRVGDAPVGIYAATVLGFSALIAAASAIGRGLRVELWVFDPAEKMLIMETSNPWGGVVSHGIEFQHIDHVRYDPRDAQLSVTAGKSTQVVCAGEIKEIALAIRELLDDTAVEFIESDT